jgi:hypothetical protein
MNERINATSVLARRRIYETFISPGFYIAMTLGLVLAYFLVAGFVRAIDSSGLAFGLNPVYELIGRSLEGAFGRTLVEKLFAEGPFVFALYIGFLPMLLYLAVSSVFRFGLEKKIGALELLAYGPADGTAGFLATYLKDLLMTVIYLVVLLAFFAITAVLNNLLLGPTFFFTLVILLFFSVAVYAYGVFASTLTDNSASAVALYLGLMVFFVIVLMGSFTIVSGYVRNLSTVFAWVVRWISPLFYWNLAMQSVEVQGWLLYAVSLIVLLVLGALVLAVSHFILKARGVRP